MTPRCMVWSRQTVYVITSAWEMTRPVRVTSCLRKSNGLELCGGRRSRRSQWGEVRFLHGASLRRTHQHPWKVAKTLHTAATQPQGWR
eukprot:4728565-Pyramimonas_sp.AAC.1